MTILKVFTLHPGRNMVESFREAGQPVTVFAGEGMKDPVQELYIACRKRDFKWMILKVYAIDIDAFYVMEQARDVSRVLKPVYTPLGMWRQRYNRK